MTTPTQAQIEVAELVNLGAGQQPGSKNDDRPLTPTQAQIEAAKQAFMSTDNLRGIDACIEAALTAAAQVGEQDKAVDAFNDGYKQAWGNAVADTIERCAQVCDEAANDPRATKEYRYFCINMAAAIRNLRDKT